MKRLIVILSVLAVIGCGSGSGSKTAVTIPEGSDLRAEVAIKTVGSGREIDVMFYISTPVAPGVKTSPPKEFIAVEEPTYNGAPMAQASSATGSHVYKADPTKWAPETVIAAKLNGKLYEGRTARDSTPGNKVTAVTLSPKN